MRTVHLVNVIWNITMKYGRNLRSLLLKFKNLSSLLRDNPSFHSRQHSGEKYFFISLLPFLVPLTRWIWFKNIFGYNSFQIIILFVLYCISDDAYFYNISNENVRSLFIFVEYDKIIIRTTRKKKYEQFLFFFFNWFPSDFHDLKFNIKRSNIYHITCFSYCFCQI